MGNANGTNAGTKGNAMLSGPTAFDGQEKENKANGSMWDGLACCDSRGEGRMNSLAGCNGRSKTEKQLDDKLMLNCTTGNDKMIQELINQGADIKAIRPEGKTCMHLAAHSGKLNCVRVLHDRCAAPDDIDNDGRTPLHIAALNGHKDVVRFLLQEADASRNVLDKNDQTPLHFACIGGHYQCCVALIEYFAYVEVDTLSNLQPLHFAALSGHTAICKLLLENNANVDVLCAEDLQSPLHCAASRGHVEVVALLIQNGAEVDIRNSSNATPLHHAAMNNHIRVVEKLLEGHANPLAIAKNNWTPMLMAFRQGHMDCGRLLERSASLMKRRSRTTML